MRILHTNFAKLFRRRAHTSHPLAGPPRCRRRPRPPPYSSRRRACPGTPRQSVADLPVVHVRAIALRRPAEGGVHDKRRMPALQCLVSDARSSPLCLSLCQAASVEVDEDELLRTVRREPVAPLGDDEVLHPHCTLHTRTLTLAPDSGEGLAASTLNKLPQISRGTPPKACDKVSQMG